MSTLRRSSRLPRSAVAACDGTSSRKGSDVLVQGSLRRRSLQLALAIVAVLATVGIPAQAAQADILDSPFHLRNTNSQLCLLVQGNVPGTQAVQWTCASFADQAWSNVKLSDGNMLTNQNSGQCLEAEPNK